MKLILLIFLCTLCETILKTQSMLQSKATQNLNREVILSSGLDGWDRDKLKKQFNAYAAYKNMNIITASSILVYEIDEYGNLDTYNTTEPHLQAEEYQQSLQGLGLKSYPCIYCDATIGNCQNLGDRLKLLFSHQQNFINTTIERAKKYNWDGYTIDLEPDQEVDPKQVTDFILDWANALEQSGMSLYVWVGGNVPYDDRLLDTKNNIKLLTMSTYSSSYDEFIQSGADQLISMRNSSNLGFGMLTSLIPGSMCPIYNIDDDTMKKITTWSRTTNTLGLSLWASTISPSWFNGLKFYLSE